VPLDSFEAVLTHASFRAMGVVNTVAVAEPAALSAALAIAESQVAAIDEACSRFKPGSELSEVNRAAGTGAVHVEPLFEEALVAAFAAAEMTDGLVDPTLGKHVDDTGYSVTFAAVAPVGPALEVVIRQVVGWRAVELDTEAHTVRVPAGVALDLGASGKAWAADRVAGAINKRLGTAVLVECGGDVAVRGRAPGDGWPVRVAIDETAPEWEDVLVREGGLATSGTTTRRWRRGGVAMHDIIDPRSGSPAVTPWSMVTVAAATCLEANAAATAALILGDGGPRWLDACRLPSRLVAKDGAVRYAGGWAA
jgi:thiamine biosynthesis lipoprotein